MNRRALKRMARRMAKRAGITGEEAVTVSFGFSSLPAAIVISILDELPYIGLIASLVTFGLHRFVLVTDKQTYVFRGRPFHRPGRVLAQYPLGPDTVARRRGKLTFSDGLIVWHSPLFTFRAEAVQEAANQSTPQVTEADAA